MHAHDRPLGTPEFVKALENAMQRNSRQVKLNDQRHQGRALIRVNSIFDDVQRWEYLGNVLSVPGLSGLSDAR